MFRRVRNLCSKIRCKRRPRRRKGGELFEFPIADGTVKLSGERSGYPKIRFSTGSSLHAAKSVKMIFEEKRTGLSRMDRMMDNLEARSDFWSIEGNYICRHHFEFGVQIRVPKEESFSIPLRYIDVIRKIHTIFGWYARKPKR